MDRMLSGIQKRRELGDPLMAITDGAPGLIPAVEEAHPNTLR